MEAPSRAVGGMTVDQANKLGVSWEFEEWLVPKFALHN